MHVKTSIYNVLKYRKGKTIYSLNISISQDRIGEFNRKFRGLNHHLWTNSNNLKHNVDWLVKQYYLLHNIRWGLLKIDDLWIFYIQTIICAKLYILLPYKRWLKDSTLNVNLKICEIISLTYGVKWKLKEINVYWYMISSFPCFVKIRWKFEYGEFAKYVYYNVVKLSSFQFARDIEMIRPWYI